ncbi:MAG: metal-dependent phosphohydrolase, partial [Pirellulaceae bacterium]|nr:metal-dependent phosphohydrolase [Pirellulaceae bacterium]
VYSPKRDLYRPLGEVSPVVRTLAQTQFDHLVKRVRIFVHPDLRNDLQSIDDPNALLHATLDRMEA